MRTISYIGGLLIALGCNSGLDSDDFERRLTTLDELNSKLLTLPNLDTINSLNSIILIGNLLKGDTMELHYIRNELMLKQIRYDPLGAIEYYFASGTKRDFEYYMLYVINLKKKEELKNHEQYVDFNLDRKDMGDHWTFVKKKESN